MADGIFVLAPRPPHPHSQCCRPLAVALQTAAMTTGFYRADCQAPLLATLYVAPVRSITPAYDQPYSCRPALSLSRRLSPSPQHGGSFAAERPAHIVSGPVPGSAVMLWGSEVFASCRVFFSLMKQPRSVYVHGSKMNEKERPLLAMYNCPSAKRRAKL